MVQLTRTLFGQLQSGEPVDLYTFSNERGLRVAITNYGGRIVSINLPDRIGGVADLVLGFDELHGYLEKNPYFGAIVGRVANRIDHAEFTLGGKQYKLAANDGTNSLHGGSKGFDKVLWSGEETTRNGLPALFLRYRSVNGEDGYPGNLDVSVHYSLSDANELRIEYQATTDSPTIVNLTNHSYFDLAGQGSGTILDHVVTLHADSFTPLNGNLVPTGEIKSVSGTPFDFRTPTRIGDRIDENDEQLKLAQGYDHNFVIKQGGTEGEPVLAAKAAHPPSGRVLEVFTTQPGVQFYTGNHLTGAVTGKNGIVYEFRTGFCLETQFFPDSPHHPEFPSIVLEPGRSYEQTTIFRFSVEP